MNFKPFFLPFTVLSFAIVLFLRPTFYDFDSYYHLSLACARILPPDNASFFLQNFFQFLPCDENSIKAVIVVVFAVSTFIIYHIGKLENEKYAVYAPLVFGLSLTYYTYFAKFEDDIFAYPFLLLSFYFLLKYLKFQEYRDYAISLGLSLVGIFFWSGSAIWTILVLLSNPIFATIGLGLIYFLRDSLFNRNPLVSEDANFLGATSVLLLVVGLLSLPGSLILPFIVACLLSLYKLKYTLFLGFLLGYATYRWACEKKFYELDLKPVLGFSKASFVLMLLIVFNLSSIVGLYSGPPGEKTIELVQAGVLLAGGSLIQNDWPLGHVIRYYGGVPHNSFGPPNALLDSNHSIKIWSEPLPGCESVSSDGIFTLYDCHYFD